MCRPGPSGADLICNKGICMLDKVSMHDLIVCFVNMMHVSTCPLLWSWYDGDTVCSMFRFLQNLLNLSEIKLSPASDIIFLGKPYSEKKRFCMLVLGYLLIVLLSF